jgi:CubicO group peptidase (beta-lactamase class C family)
MTFGCGRVVRRLSGLALALITGAAAPLAAQPAGRIDLEKMRPAGLLVDPYSYMAPPHNRYYFHHIDRLGVRHDWVARGGSPIPLRPAIGDPPVFAFRAPGEARGIDLEEYFDRNHVTGFLVLRGDTILVERYFHGADRRSRFVSQSVGKSIVSILVGVAVDQGKIRRVEDRVVEYLPDLAASGYRDATVKNVLQMASGVDYSEDYRDSTSGAARIGAALITGRPPFSEFVRSMRPTATPPGTKFEYQSVNTQLLGWLLERVTGERLNRWASRALWSKLGAESDAFFYQARRQRETCAFACFNATLRDYGRIGLLMLGGGSIGGRRIVSEGWVRQSTTADADYLKPSSPNEPGPPRYGYGYQWWIPPGTEGAYYAFGIYGQTIYLNPAKRLVVVQMSAWPTPLGDERLGFERAAMMEAIAREVGGR